jgi:hypothetical protein
MDEPRQGRGPGCGRVRRRPCCGGVGGACQPARGARRNAHCPTRADLPRGCSGRDEPGGVQGSSFPSVDVV